MALLRLPWLDGDVHRQVGADPGVLFIHSSHLVERVCTLPQELVKVRHSGRLCEMQRK